MRWRVDFWRGPEVVARADAALSAGVRRGAEQVARRADGLTPYETGHLRASQRIEGQGKGARISYTADYAVPVHEVPPTSGGVHGTGYTHAPPTGYKFLERAMREESPGVLATIAAHLRRRLS